MTSLLLILLLSLDLSLSLPPPSIMIHHPSSAPFYSTVTSITDHMVLKHFAGDWACMCSNAHVVLVTQCQYSHQSPVNPPAHLVSLVAVCCRDSSLSWSDCSGRMFFSSSSLFDGRLLNLMARESFRKTFMASVPTVSIRQVIFVQCQTNQLCIIRYLYKVCVTFFISIISVWLFIIIRIFMVSFQGFSKATRHN